MVRALKIISNAKTHVGKVRSQNQDAYLEQPKAGIWLVADGMGGHHNGEYASQLLTSEIQVPSEVKGIDQLVDFVKLTIQQKNYQLFHYASKLGDGVRCGTTVVCLIVYGLQASILWVGDSRVYQYSTEEQSLKQVTKDHTVFSEMKEKGLVDDYHPMAEKYKGALARVVGGDESVEIDEMRLVLSGNERFLLCSDGITKELSDEDIWQCLSKHLSPGVTCSMMLNEGLSKNARDNMTACVVDISFV